ncbi:MAG TPA: protein kinase [Chitinispirillaceae bacterium]|nr:protein kinase [Chitinispirillaceae bacterium]
MFHKPIIGLSDDFSCPIVLGEGMYSAVYRAYQNSLDRIVAVKILNTDKSVFRQIHSEARILAATKIPCVPVIFDVKQEKKATILVMEWIRGIPLDRFCSLNSDVLLRKVAAAGLIKSLSMVHKLGIAHRDLKPENIILSPDGTVFLVDFGFAAESVRHEFSTDKISGTPQFMAPELWSCSDKIDYQKSDMYALGAILEQVLGIELVSYLSDLKNLDPEKRPGVDELLLKWVNQETSADLDALYSKEISLLTSEYLANKYFQEARKYYAQKHIKESYEIIAEVLEEIPDHIDALTMLQSMQHDKKTYKNGKNILAGALAAAIFLIFYLAFELGRSVEDRSSGSTLLPTDMAAKDRFIDISSPVGALSGGIYLKNDMGQSLIEGEFCCIVPKGSGILRVDGVVFKRDINENDGHVFMSLTQGVHSIEWVDSITEQTISESVNILPFEKKKIRLFFTDDLSVTD